MTLQIESVRTADLMKKGELNKTIHMDLGSKLPILGVDMDDRSPAKKKVSPNIDPVSKRFRKKLDPKSFPTHLGMSGGYEIEEKIEFEHRVKKAQVSWHTQNRTAQ